MRRLPCAAGLVLIFFLFASCTPNNPYRPADSGKNILYSTFNEPPKHLDPAKSYSSDEYELIAQIYEPPLQYHYLIRPYELVPLASDGMPAPVYLGMDGARLSETSPADKVGRVVYEIKIKNGVMYQPHPAFARKPDGSPRYLGLTPRDVDGVSTVKDFKETGTREATAGDYILEVKRLADPLIESPILPILEKYILGLKEYSEALRKDLEETRKKRKEAAGPAYNQTLDERKNPIILDYNKHPLPGAVRVDDHTYRIILKAKYPQFIYWLAMPFFSPVPQEALDFYGQGALMDKNITLDRFPVGTGPYMMDVYDPNMEITLVRNPNFHPETYPDRGEAGDREAGLLKDAGARLPFVDMAVFKLEKEAIPRWNKFLQGYYDNSGISSESFDQAVTLSASGRAELTEAMKAKGIRLETSVRPSSYYMGFNMLDDTVGGYGADKQKLRQAISIALDYEEYIDIFLNGRGIPAMSALPPGIFGHLDGEEGINPYVYAWDARKRRAQRRPIEYAQELMREAGYPAGVGRDGRPLTITLDNPWTGPDFTPVIAWYIKKLKLLGIQLENRTTDYNRFQEKMLKGNFQLFSWGWNADYPDPENFFFLLNGAGGKVRYQGENAANYSSAQFDRLFKMMESMTNSPERLRVIKEMVSISQKDAPWVWGYHPVAFGLYHQWVSNVKPNAMANNNLKYLKIDVPLRNRLRSRWNRPVIWPVAAVAVVLGAIIAFAAISARRRSA